MDDANPIKAAFYRIRDGVVEYRLIFDAGEIAAAELDGWRAGAVNPSPEPGEHATLATFTIPADELP